MKLSETMQQKSILSFEVFPPKTEKGMEHLSDTIAHLGKYQPEYISCTYGAGGNDVGRNMDVCKLIKDAGTTPVAHFTCIGNSREDIRGKLQQFLDNGVHHMLALRGDLPSGWTGTGGDFSNATDLVAYVRKEFGDQFEIAVAGCPEGHIDCRSLEADIAFLKQKQDNGADFIMTQLCWDMEQFKRWLDAIRKAGITLPVDVGIMPILDMASTISMALSRNGCVMERKLSKIISKYWIFPNPFDKEPTDEEAEDKKAGFLEAGKQYTIEQIDTYRACGVNGIHLYAMNKWKEVSEIIDRAGIRTIM